MQKATSRAGVLEIRAECHYHSGLSRRSATGRGLELPKKQVITNMKTVVGVATALFALALFAQPALAEGNAAAGQELGHTCFGCHGIEGCSSIVMARAAIL